MPYDLRRWSQDLDDKLIHFVYVNTEISMKHDHIILTLKQGPYYMCILQPEKIHPSHTCTYSMHLYKLTITLLF